METDRSKYGSNQMIEVLMTPTSESSDNLIYDEADEEEEQVVNKDLDIEDDEKKKKPSLFNGEEDAHLVKEKDEDSVVVGEVVNGFSTDSPDPKAKSAGHLREGSRK